MKNIFLVIGGIRYKDYSRVYTSRNMKMFDNKKEAQEYANTFWDFEKKEGYINFVEIKYFDLFDCTKTLWLSFEF